MRAFGAHLAAGFREWELGAGGEVREWVCWVFGLGKLGGGLGCMGG